LQPVAILHSHLTFRIEETTVKTTARAVIFVLLATAMGRAETPVQLGAWAVHPTRDHRVILLQTMSDQSQDGQDNPVQARLDVICANGKLHAVALEPNVAIEARAISFAGVVPTTRVSFTLDGDNNRSEKWAVLDDGHTLSPYSEISQGRLTRRWAERISGLKTIGFQVQGIAGQRGQVSFETGQLSEALSAVGCSY
jgi:hypothetical protein